MRRNRSPTIDAPLGEVAQRLRPAARLGKFRGAGTAEKRPAYRDNAAHVTRAELSQLTIDQALPTLFSSFIGQGPCRKAYATVEGQTTDHYLADRVVGSGSPCHGSRRGYDRRSSIAARQSREAGASDVSVLRDGTEQRRGLGLPVS